MRCALLLILLGAVACSGTPAHERDQAIRRAAEWLWAQQAEDGGWHSETYGLLRSGQALTPFVLHVLKRVPGIEPPAQGEQRAVTFIAKNLDADGALGRADPDLEEYPCYATAHAVSALAPYRGVCMGSVQVPAGTVARMAKWLRGQQFAEPWGWKPDDPPYGAWGLGGEPRKPPHAGHLDLSMTRHVLEALATDGPVAAVDPAFQKAAVYVERCRNRDNGFHFSTVVLGANKAGPMGDGYRSYGTTTADGILSLLAMGVSKEHSSVQTALTWLVEHHRVDRVPGLPDGEAARWRDAMIHYYWAASARVFHKTGVIRAPPRHDWRKQMAAAIVARQRADGGFKNDSVLMKEDDPLIATTLALDALLSTRRSLGQSALARAK